MALDDDSVLDQHEVLSDPPLIRVLCQVRWSKMTRFDVEHVWSQVAEALGGTYPFRADVDEVELAITPHGVQQKSTGQILRLSTADSSWTVSVGTTFLALETSKYLGHVDFVERLQAAVKALFGVVNIARTDRIGYRYTNRVSGDDDLSHLAERYDPGVVGGSNWSASDELLHSVTESLFQGSGARVMVRSAHLAAGASIDPTIPALEARSWVLDIDAFDESQVVAPTPETIATRATELSQLAHSKFRQLVTDDFYARHR